MPGELSRQVPALTSASAAYGFLLHHVTLLLRLLFLPLIAFAAVLVALGTAIGLTGFVALIAWLGLPIAAIVGRTEGTVLRKALHEGARQFGQNCMLVLLLAVPGLAIEMLSEYVVRLGTVSPRV